MTATIATERPNFHGLTGTQAIGRTQVAAAATYAGSITTCKRTNTTTWVVVTRSACRAFAAQAERGAACTIWRDTNGRYIVNYWDEATGLAVEADDTRSLRAAIGVAADVSARNWAATR